MLYIVSMREININYFFFLRSFLFNLNCKFDDCKISKGAKIRNRYNQVLNPTQDTNGKVTNFSITKRETQDKSKRYAYN